MALIETLTGDFEMPIASQESINQTGIYTLNIPATLSFAQDGSLNEWCPVNLSVYDGGPQPIQIAGYVTKVNGDGVTVSLEIRDSSVYFSRIGKDTPWIGTHPILSLLATNADNSYERHIPSAALVTGSSEWVGDWGIITGATLDPPYMQGAISRISCCGFMISGVPFSGTTADKYITFSWNSFQAAGSGIYKVSVEVNCDFYFYEKAYTLPPIPPLWLLTMNVSNDGGVTWGPAHTITVDYTDFNWNVDITNDFAWTLSSFSTAGQVQVQLTCAAATSYNAGGGPVFRFITSVYLDVHYSYVYGQTLPVIPGSIDTTTVGYSLPVDHKYISEWLQQLVDISAYEWSVRPIGKLGWSKLNWQKSVGGVFSATVLLNGKWVPIAGLESEMLSQQPTTVIDGMQAVNRVYSYNFDTNGNLVSAVANDTISQEAIGIQELINKANSSDSSYDLQAQSNSILQMHLHSQIAFTVVVPKIPGLWSALVVGATMTFRADKMPYVPWEGTVRILSRSIDELKDNITLTLLPLASKLPAARGSGTAVPPNRTAQQSKLHADGELRLIPYLAQVIKSYWHPRRQ